MRGTTASGYVGQPWAISQEINCSSPSEFNHAARNSLASGLNALNMVLDKATRNGHDPDWAQAGGSRFRRALHRDARATWTARWKALTSETLRSSFAPARRRCRSPRCWWRWRGSARKRPACLRGCIEMDPLGVLSHEGSLPQSLEGAYREMAALTRWAADARAAVANHLRPQPRLARSRRQCRAGTGFHPGHRRRISPRK